jgi:multiple sugar transport system ATP-binding protein
MVNVELQHIYKSYEKVPVLKDLNLDIEDGEFFVLLGASGSGKSTTLNILAGLEPITSGNILFDGKNVNNLSPIDRGVSMVFQDYALYPHMTVYKNLAFPLKMLRYKNESIKRIIKEVSEKLEIEQLLNRYPRQLSGGQAQRVALGRSLVRNPTIFLLDEPLSNLDANIRSSIRNELKLMQESLGKTFVYVTHDQMEAMSLGDHIGILHNGKIEQFGKPIDIYRHPVNSYVATFLGDPEINLFSYKNDSGIFSGDGPFKFKLPVKDAIISIGIRPENITLKRTSDDDIEGAIIPRVTELLGSHTLIIGNINNKEIKIITDESDIENGKTLAVYTNLSKILVFNEQGDIINL